MKLLVVLMLAALPLYCYAGSGCKLLETIIAETINPEVSIEEYLELVKNFVHSKHSENAAKEFKQCFLNQSNETLANTQVMMDIIYDSNYCVFF